jgi:hypothetical protein
MRLLYSTMVTMLALLLAFAYFAAPAHAITLRHDCLRLP